jgi:hypothetical protein
MYKDLGWTLITDHIHYSVGKHLVQRNDFQKAIAHYIELLHRSRQTANVHRAYLSEFLFLYQKCIEMYADKNLDLSSNLSIPIVITDSVIAVSETGNTNSYSDTWDAMEKEILDFSILQNKRIYQNSENESKLECAVGGKVKL